MLLMRQLRGHLSKQDTAVDRQYFVIAHIVTREIMGITCSRINWQKCPSIRPVADRSRRSEADRSR